eukprot:TRINITY_DN110405_c0_g1_i1.p1 TRINITY_DN110405_c0_g1~~TRINITY_DN110405_c0_g1_i1.p1  ORF type:complete len:249 (+),score=31.77 TRINITY_DN110405_c0_g1_i1:47-748(+)
MESPRADGDAEGSDVPLDDESGHETGRLLADDFVQPNSTKLCTKTFQRRQEDFTCEHCGFLEHGNGYTNHCSQCLWSKHVDINPGDRAADCGGLMAPIGIDTKSGDYRILQRCGSCGHERWNKRQDQDNFDTLLEISAGAAPSSQCEKVHKAKGRGKSKRTDSAKQQNSKTIADSRPFEDVQKVCKAVLMASKAFYTTPSNAAATASHVAFFVFVDLDITGWLLLSLWPLQKS